MIRKILFVAVILALLAMSFLSCKLFPTVATPTPIPTPIPTPTPIAPPPTAIHPTPTPAPMPTPLNYYDFGDLVISSPWQISMSTPQRLTTYSEPGSQRPPPGSVFLLVPVSLWNVGNTSFQVAAQNFQVVSATGATYGATETGVWFNSQAPFPYHAYTVQPSGSVSGIIMYTPPATATDLSIRILVNGQYLVWNVP